uniref:Xyloglucan endotransglucosylase/hydrolase n=1 Tax=Ananas comosus var. bracteatus TaxID=296719 RepID=A0A6V7QJV9_ANACO|nr:unnamed protein product [Ananas comosus var. bracteatus]
MAMGKPRAVLVAFALLAVLDRGLVRANFYDECDVTWGPQNTAIWGSGENLALSLDSDHIGSAIRTKKQFLFGSVEMEIQLVPDNSAGTVAAYYTSSLGDYHDEIDYEFLGNETGQPYTIHTNVFGKGQGNKEVQFKPWFDRPRITTTTPSSGAQLRLWFIDQIPIRVYRNYESAGAPFPTNQPMRMYSSLWNADDWACQGGRVKTDWSKAPFVAKYRNLKLDVCECESADSISQCYSSSNWYNGWQYSKLTAAQLGQMNWVQQNYKIYDYCTDYKRFNGQMPVECSLPQY